MSSLYLPNDENTGLNLYAWISSGVNSQVAFFLNFGTLRPTMMKPGLRGQPGPAAGPQARAAGEWREGFSEVRQAGPRKAGWRSWSARWVNRRWSWIF